MRASLALVFDLDGVVVDSNPVHREAWSVYNSRFGIETTEEMQQRMYGKHNAEIVRDFFGSHLTQEETVAHGRAKEEVYRRLTGERLEQMIVPGLRGFLARHAARPLGVASNAELANIDFVLDGAGLRPYFQVVLHGEDVANPKPAPDIYLLAADRLGVPPSRTVIFEDSLTGAAAATASGAMLVGVATTLDSLPGASLMIRGFDDPRLDEFLEQAAGR